MTRDEADAAQEVLAVLRSDIGPAIRDEGPYYQWNRDRPFHMDYILVPSEWTLQAVEVGAFEDYTAKKLSDHVRVIVTASLREDG